MMFAHVCGTSVIVISFVLVRLWIMWHSQQSAICDDVLRRNTAMQRILAVALRIGRLNTF